MKTSDHGPIQDLALRLGSDLDGTFETLVTAFQDRLYAFALRLSGNTQDAEEVTQDAFVRAYLALKGYPEERIRALALRPWLYQITLNVYRNRVRGKRLAIFSTDAVTDDGDGLEPADTAGMRPDAYAERSELQEELATRLAGLPERYRAAVVLRFVEGLTYAEAAAVLDQPLGTVKANVHRGVRILRERMLVPA